MTYVMRYVIAVRTGGTAQRIPVATGAPGTDTWNGTMVVTDEQQKVCMDSRTVGLGDTHHGYCFWAVDLTTPGTYVHENPRADAEVGHHNVTHGCVSLPSDGTARRIYGQVRAGDVVTVTGADKATVAPGNGYGYGYGYSDGK